MNKRRGILAALAGVFVGRHVVMAQEPVVATYQPTTDPTFMVIGPDGETVFKLIWKLKDPAMVIEADGRTATFPVKQLMDILTAPDTPTKQP